MELIVTLIIIPDLFTLEIMLMMTMVVILLLRLSQEKHQQFFKMTKVLDFTLITHRNLKPLPMV